MAARRFIVCYNILILLTDNILFKDHRSIIVSKSSIKNNLLTAVEVNKNKNAWYDFQDVTSTCDKSFKTTAIATYDPRIPFAKRDLEYSLFFLEELVNSDVGTSVVASPLDVLFTFSQLAYSVTGPQFKKLIANVNLSRKDELLAIYPKLKNIISKEKHVTCNLAYKVYANIQYPLNQNFVNNSQTIFRAYAENIDFSKPYEATASINDWAKSQTNGTVEDVIFPFSVDASTEVVLVNAVNFKTYWKTQFDRSKTKNRVFYVDKDIRRIVKLMYIKAKFRYTLSLGLSASIIEIPFAGNLSMVLVLPFAFDGINSLANKLKNQSLINDALSTMKKQTVNLYMPSFKTLTTTDLPNIIERINNTGLFDATTPGLSGILQKPAPVSVTNYVQKAYIVVNEDGNPPNMCDTDQMLINKFKTPEYTFYANHPFVYFINFIKRPKCPLLCGMYLGD